jgi:hypothetical protein
LAIVVAILFILVVLVLAMHTSQSKAVRNVTQAEAELQFRQGFEFAVADLLAEAEPKPGWLKVTGDTEMLEESNLPEEYSKTLFSDSGLPSLDPKDKEHPPGFQTSKVVPDTNDAALQVFRGKFQWLVTQQSGGYAVYAPKGKISLQSVAGWSNPTLDDEREAADAYSGVPVLLACLSDMEVEDLVYGRAYSVEGDIVLGGEGGIGFQGRPPLRAYEEKLRGDLDSLQSEMARSASSGDKTSQIEGDALATVGSMVSLIFGGNDIPSLSLQQAMAIPFPMIPGFSATVPGVFYEFWFHMPDPPDFADFDNPGGGDPEADGKEAKRLQDAIDKVKAEIADLDTKIRQANTEREKDRLRAQKADKEAELRGLEREARDLQDRLEDSAAENEDKVRNNVSSDPPDQPTTRREDKDIPNTGIKGWAYARVFGNFFGLLKDTLTGDFENIAKRFYNDVRVVHFGRKDTEPEFRFDNGFFAKATLNVPPGRTFRFNGNCEFEGDLWLQKGSVMHVGGDLTLSDPSGGSSNPFKPSGRLVMEEGSTLVVDGDLVLEGQSLFGSLWICSQPGTIHPVNTAILASGSVTIPHGSFTSTNLEDAAKWVVSKEGGLDGVQDVLNVLFQDVAPNLSKIGGPFHTRQPFFASHPATFQLTIVPTPFGPIPIPSPIPLPKKNVLVPIFRGFTYAYTPAMNVALGENLYTQADWWGFGEGTVPVLVKIDPVRMARAMTEVNLGGLNLDDINWEDQLETLMDDVLEGAMQFVVEKIVRAVMEQLAKAAIPGGALLDFIPAEVFDGLGDKDKFLEDIQKAVIDATLGPIITELERWVDDLRDQVEDGLSEGYLREVNGPLIYADTISVGEDSNSRLMVGMLVAKSNITVESRTFVGSMLCLDGDITAQDVLFTPYFTRASLYKPKPTDSNWLVRAADWEYGKRRDSENATGIDTGVKVVRTEGWSR